MTPRSIITFLVLFFLMVFGEWFRYLRGFDTSIWTVNNWLAMIGVLVAEGIAAAIIAAAADKAFPSPNARASVRASKRPRRSSQRPTAR